MPCIFKALADSTRRQILSLLKGQDMSAGDIAAHFNISWPSISHHLSVLRAADIIVNTKEGQNVIYSINTKVLAEITAWLADLSKTKSEGEKEFENQNFIVACGAVSDSVCDCQRS